MAHDQRHERHRATVMRALLPLSLSLSLSRGEYTGVFTCSYGCRVVYSFFSPFPSSRCARYFSQAKDEAKVDFASSWPPPSPCPQMFTAAHCRECCE